MNVLPISLRPAVWPTGGVDVSMRPRLGAQRAWRLAGHAQHTTWSEFYKVTQHTGPRRLLLDALEHAGHRAFSQGLSVDLGAGAGGAARVLHDRTHWQVHAVDADPAAHHFLTQRFGAQLPERVRFEQACFQTMQLPPREVDLLWAGLSLPYVSAQDVGAVWEKVIASLRPGGIFAGDFFGPDHGHFGRADMNFHDPEQMARLLAGLDTVQCERIRRPSPFSQGRVLMMDVYHVIAIKP